MPYNEPSSIWNGIRIRLRQWGIHSLVLCTALSYGYSQLPSSTVSYPSPAVCALQEDLERILEHPAMQSLFAGIYVVSLRSNEVLFNRNADRLFIPASLLKLFTTATALDFLGADYRFRTVVLTDGFIVHDSILRGNLILWSNGNPALSSIFQHDCAAVLRLLADQLYQRGIRVVEGDLYAADSYFDRQFWAEGWGIDDIAYAYAAPVSALSCQDNVVRVVLRHLQTSDLSSFTMLKIPDYPFVTVDLQVSVVDSGTTTLSVHRDPCAVEYVIEGTVAPTSFEDSLEILLPVDDPSLFAAFVFAQQLQQRGIVIQGQVQRSDRMETSWMTQWETLVEWVSPPLSQLIAGINQHSYNLGAEMLLKALGKIFRGEGTWSAGIDAVLSFLRHVGIDVEDIRMVDGSGLSRMNLISPRHVAQLLQFMYQRKYRKIFLHSLAQPGKPGTLEHRLEGIPPAQNVFAKTGTLTGVYNIAGYLYSRDYEPLLFVVMMNHTTAPAFVIRNIQDLLLLRLLNFSRQTATQQQ